MSEQIELVKFNFNVDDVVKSASQLKEAIDLLQEEQKELKKNGDSNSTTFVDNASKIKALNKEYGRHISLMESANKTKLDSVNRQDRLNKVIGLEAISIDQLRQKNKQLNALRNSTNITTAKGREELKLLNTELDKNNELIKNNVDQYTQQKINIGNYSSALQGVSPQLSMLVTQGQTMITTLKGMKTGLAGTSKGLKLFRIALISTGIGAIVVALGLMIGFFLKTQKAVDGLTKFLTPLKEIFSSIVGVLESLGAKLVKTFSDPKKAIEDFKNLIKENIQNRIDGLIETFGILGNVIKKALQFDFAGAKKESQGLGEALSKSATGIENFGSKIKKFGKDASDFFNEASERGQEIADLGISAEEQEIKLVTLRSKNLKIIKEQELIAKNQLLTDAERKKALDIALEKTKEIEAAELRLLDTKIKQVKLSHEGSDTSREELLELANLQAERDDKQQASINTELRFLGTKKQLNDEAERKNKKAKEDQIKALNEQIDLYIAQAGTRAKTLKEEVAIAEEVARRKKEILDKQLEGNLISETKYKTELQNLKNEDVERKSQLLVDEATKEIEAYRQTAERKKNIDVFLSEAQLDIQKTHNNSLLKQEKEYLGLKLEQGVISQEEYNTEINRVIEENRLANKELETERKQIEKEEQAELDALAFEEELIKIEEQGLSRLDTQKKIDELKRQKEIDNLDQSVMSKELYNAKVDAIDHKYEKIKAGREKILRNQKLQLTQQLLSGIAGLVDKNSAAGKAVAIAQAGINTFQGITEGLKAPFPLNIAMPILAGVTGLAATKKIMDTKVPSMRGGGGAGGVSLPSNAMGSITAPTGGNLSSSNITVQGGVESDDLLKNANSGIESAVERGAEKGSNSGSNEGITNLTENRQIQNESAF